MTNAKLGLLVMHYGTPASLDDVLPYYTHIRRGRPPTDEALADLVGRYEAIGGVSPLNAITRRQAEGIQAGLKELGIEATLYIGAKHAVPFVADCVRQMAADGVERVAGVVLAPHFSRTSIGAYRQYALDARDEAAPSMQINVLERWGTLPEFIWQTADHVREQLSDWDATETLVIFSAHSLPLRAVEGDDPYVAELYETAQLVAHQAEIPNWKFAFQSASSTGEPWIGPDVLDLIAEVAGHYKNIISCTVGFVSDHLEVLYDLGIEARDKCAEVGLNFRRAECINDDPVVMSALARELVPLFGE